MTRFTCLTVLAAAIALTGLSTTMSEAGGKSSKPDTRLTSQIDGIVIAGPGEAIRIGGTFASAGGLGTTR